MSTISTVNPATGQVVREYPVMSDTQLEGLVDQADKAYRQWKKTTFERRRELLHMVAGILRERKEELAKLFALEMGKLIPEGIAEVEVCAAIFDYYALQGEDMLADRPIEAQTGKAFLTFEPIGVILSVQPWNFPFYQITRSAAPVIMAGNTILLKHASNVPQAAQAMEDIFRAAGAPEGVYTNLFIPGERASELAADPRIKGVSLTGSEPAGSSIASVAGKYIKRSTLELGGSDAFIVMPDADVDLAVKTAAEGRLWNAGQVCISPKRIIVTEDMFGEFVARAKAIYDAVKVGDPLDPATQLGPLSSEKALEGVLEQVRTAVQEGATLVTGGKRIDGPGAFMQPTILTGIRKGTQAYSQEVFGPVLIVYSVKDMDEAVELANDTDFGLGGTVFGKDTAKAVEIARRIETGMVYINHVTGISPQFPFGGVKHSGYGREHSRYGIEEFVNPKLIRITTPDAVN